LERRADPADAENPVARRDQIQRRIHEIQREILGIENGDLYETIAEQPSAPSCSICEEGPLGFPGQPTPADTRVKALQEELRALQRQLSQADRGSARR
jgi:hypothetical protein